MPIFNVKQQRAYYYEVSGAGFPFLLLHGFTGSVHNWATHIPVFSQCYQIIAIDILGHGRSAIPTKESDYALQKIASDLILLLDSIGIPKANLLGYSMGGRLALYLAIFYPHRFHSLVLESASPGLDTAVARQERIKTDRALADWLEANGIEAFVNRWEQLPLWASQAQLPKETQRVLRQQRLQNNQTGLANSLRGMGTGQQPSLWSELPTLNLSTQLLAGEHDPKFTTINQQMATKIPNVNLEIISGAGHTIHLERPYHFQQTILNFLKNHE